MRWRERGENDSAIPRNGADIVLSQLWASGQSPFWTDWLGTQPQYEAAMHVCLEDRWQYKILGTSDTRKYLHAWKISLKSGFMFFQLHSVSGFEQTMTYPIFIMAASDQRKNRPFMNFHSSNTCTITDWGSCPLGSFWRSKWQPHEWASWDNSIIIIPEQGVHEVIFYSEEF